MVNKYAFLVCVDGNCVAGTGYVNISEDRIELRANKALVLLVRDDGNGD